MGADELSRLISRPRTIAWRTVVRGMVLCVAAVLLSACVRDDYRPGANGCDSIRLNSVDGFVSVRRSAIAGLGRTRGESGSIDWVDIVAPAAPSNVAGLSRMTSLAIIWNMGEDNALHCRTRIDPALGERVNCRVSMPDTELAVIASFEPTGVDLALARMRELAQYASLDVLCHEAGRT